MTRSMFIEKATLLGMLCTVLTFAGTLLLYTTAVYGEWLPLCTAGVGVCVGIASLIGGWFASKGKSGKLLRSVMGGFVPFLLLLLGILLCKKYAPEQETNPILWGGISALASLLAAGVSAGKKASSGKQRKHNSYRKAAGKRH